MTKHSPFRYFKTSPEIIRLAVMLYVRFPLSLRNVEDLLHERGIEISHETVRFWWNRFGPMFAAEIRRNRVSRMRSYSNWQWHLDEVFVKINGETHYLWRAVDHEGEVLESYVTKRRDRKAALKFLRKVNEALRRARSSCDGQTAFLPRCNESCLATRIGRKRVAGVNNRAENSHLPFRRRETRYAPLSTDATSAESSLQSTLQSTTISIRNATSIHETISSSTDPPLLLSGANY